MMVDLTWDMRSLRSLAWPCAGPIFCDRSSDGSRPFEAWWTLSLEQSGHTQHSRVSELQRHSIQRQICDLHHRCRVLLRGSSMALRGPDRPCGSLVARWPLDQSWIVIAVKVMAICAGQGFRWTAKTLLFRLRGVEGFSEAGVVSDLTSRAKATALANGC
jgi:hypothetical protein